MKSKQIKILRKKLEKANKTGYDLPEGTALNWSVTPSNTTNDDEKKDTNDTPTTLTLKSWSPQDLKTSQKLPELMKLFEENMAEQYRKSSWGLNLEEKQAELSHAKARFLVLLDAEEELAGFCHYRLDYDDEDAPADVVVYVYELQIRERYRRQGLGKKLMAIVEQMALKLELPKVMLTVFRINQAAIHFYQGLDYVVDESSPSQHGEKADYEILSKKIGK